MPVHSVQSFLQTSCCLYSQRNSLSTNPTANPATNSGQTLALSHHIFHPPDGVALVQPYPIVFLHGLMGNKRNFQGISKALAKAGNKVITVDCRNHGDSPHAIDMTYIDMSRDLERLLGDLNIAEAVVVGHSMGGKVAMTLALTQSPLVSRLVIVDISPRLSSSNLVDNFPLYFSLLRDMELDHSKSYREVLAEGERLLQPHVPEKSIRDFLLTNIRRKLGQGAKGYEWRVNFDAIISNYGNIVGFPDFESCYLGTTLFIGGKNSPYIVESDYPEIERLFPCAEVTHVPDAGHWVHADQPHRFIQLLAEFVART